MFGLLGLSTFGRLPLFFGPHRFDPKENPCFDSAKKSTFGRLPIRVFAKRLEPKNRVFAKRLEPIRVFAKRSGGGRIDYNAL